MIRDLTPMRWPAGWSAGQLELLRGTAINCLVGASGGPVAEEAAKRGLTVVEGNRLPLGVTMLKGAWPGVRMSRGGGASTGPTGTAWVDTNGYRVRLEAALHPGTRVWIDAAPAPDRRLHADAYVVAFADSAAYGGRWVISLDERLAAGIVAGDAGSLKSWKKLAGTADLFEQNQDWTSYTPAATVGVVSDFSGKDLFPNEELVNLLGRAGQQYRILPKTGELVLSGLRAVVYGDADAPSAAVRERCSEFVRTGGLLVTGPAWGEIGEAVPDQHPRFVSRKLGDGRVAISGAKLSDPYQLANDVGVLVSHRYDLVRLWNAGSAGSYLTKSQDGAKALLHLLFYANDGPDSASVRIAGKYKRAWMEWG